MTKTSRETFESGYIRESCVKLYPITDIVQNFWPNVFVYLDEITLSRCLAVAKDWNMSSLRFIRKKFYEMVHDLATTRWQNSIKGVSKLMKTPIPSCCIPPLFTSTHQVNLALSYLEELVNDEESLQNNTTLLFLGNLIILTTRVWEVFGRVDSQQNFIFPSTIQHFDAVFPLLLKDIFMLQTFLKSTVSFQCVPLEVAVRGIRKVFICHLKILQKIVPEVTVEILNEFLDSQILYFVNDFSSIHGLSTHHGRILFINSVFLENPSQLEIEIQHELANNLPKWFQTKKGALDYKYIPAASNSNLRLNDRMVDSGFYYLFHALALNQDAPPEDLNPFYYRTRFSKQKKIQFPTQVTNVF